MTCWIEALTLICDKKRIVMLTSRPLTSLVDVSCSIGADPFLNMHETWPMQNQIQSKRDRQS